jgi:hypothetical protein
MIMANQNRPARVQIVVVAVLLLAVAWTAAFGWPAVGARAHGVEAMGVLGRIARGAAVYYVKPRGQESGGRMLCQFPQGETRSSAAASCCDPAVNLAGTPYCDPEKLTWNTTIWTTIGVEVADPQPFVFHYEASGAMGDARYVVSAYGDLDCDGQMSTFRFVGKGDPASRADDCILTTRPVFTSDLVRE